MNTSDIDLIIERIHDSDPDIQLSALESLKKEIKTSQDSIHSRVENIHDFIRDLETCSRSMVDENRRLLYDILSVLEGGENALDFKLLGNTTDLKEWGHQYVKKLIYCILERKNTIEEYFIFVEPIIEFLFGHNSEIEAIDFIIEIAQPALLSAFDNKKKFFETEIKIITDFVQDGGVMDDQQSVSEKEEKEEIMFFKQRADAKREELLDSIASYVDDNNRDRIRVYLEEMAKFYDLKGILLKVCRYDPSRFVVGLLRYGMTKEAVEFVEGLEDPNHRLQCQYILFRSSVRYEASLDGSHLAGTFLRVAKSLEILAPKELDYVFSGLNRDRIDVAAIANGLVHFGFQRDPVFYPQENDFKLKEEHAEQLKLNKSIATVASAGLINAFSSGRIAEEFADEIYGTPEIGAVLAMSLAFHRFSGDDSILDLLASFVNSERVDEVIAALTGIAIVYTNTHHSPVYDLVLPLLSSPHSDICHFAIYVLGAVFAGDLDVFEPCSNIYKELKPESNFANFSVLGIALFFYRHYEEESSDLVVSALAALDKHTRILALGFMFLGTGDSSVIDRILSETFVGEIDALLESLGLISCCLIGIGDSVAIQLIERICTSSLLLDSPHLRNIVPLCIALLYISNPKIEIIDFLEKTINSGECNVNSLVSLGIVCAGTCSSRASQILDSNFGHVYKDPKASIALILTQGMVDLGKGMCTLSPLAYNNSVIMKKNMISMVSTLFLFIEFGIMKDYPFLYYLITNAISTKYITAMPSVEDSKAVDINNETTEDEYVEGSIKIGRPVDVVGKAGKPNRLSAIVTHSMPVVLNTNELAETEDEVYTSYVEDILIRK